MYTIWKCSIVLIFYLDNLSSRVSIIESFHCKYLTIDLLIDERSQFPTGPSPKTFTAATLTVKEELGDGMV